MVKLPENFPLTLPENKLSFKMGASFITEGRVCVYVCTHLFPSKSSLVA